MVVVLALSGLFLWPGFEATLATSGTVSEPSDEVTSSLLRCLKIRSWFSRSLWSVVKCVQVSCDTNNFFDCCQLKGTLTVEGTSQVYCLVTFQFLKFVNKSWHIIVKLFGSCENVKSLTFRFSHEKWYHLSQCSQPISLYPIQSKLHIP